MNTHECRQLGEAITKSRKKAGFTQEQLANIIKIAPRTYQDYEAGKIQPRYKTLFKIALATNSSPLELIEPMWKAWKDNNS